jgi:hypothetical protein
VDQHVVRNKTYVINIKVNTLHFIELAKSNHFWPNEVWHSSDKPIDINKYHIIKEKTPQLYFVKITLHWAKRSQNQNSAKSHLLKGRKLYLPTLIARNVPCTKVQWMMGAVCHQQPPWSQNRKVIMLAKSALDNIKACQSHGTTPKRTGVTKTQQASPKTLAPRQTNKSKNEHNSLSLTHSQIACHALPIVSPFMGGLMGRNDIVILRGKDGGKGL